MAQKTRIRTRKKHGFPPYPYISFKDYNKSKWEMWNLLHFLTPVLAKSLETTKQIISKQIFKNESEVKNEF